MAHIVSTYTSVRLKRNRYDKCFIGEMVLDGSTLTLQASQGID